MTVHEQVLIDSINKLNKNETLKDMKIKAWSNRYEELSLQIKDKKKSGAP